jgi:ATF/CREB family transcription factor
MTRSLTTAVAEPPKVEPAPKTERKCPVGRRAHRLRWQPLAHRANHDAAATTEEASTSDAKPPVSNAPLGPPPRPTTTGDTPDYFNT